MTQFIPKYLVFMKAQIWSFFLVLTSCNWSNGQIDERFNGPEIFSSDDWAGDIDKFVLDDQMLRLKDNDPGTALITHPISLDSLWEITIDAYLDFAPSDQNMLRIDLWHKDEDNALFIQIGENGNNDAVSLWQISRGNRALLYEGTAGAVSQDPTKVSFNLRRENDSFEITILYGRGVIDQMRLTASQEK